jgi:hypothetical protein
MPFGAANAFLYFAKRRIPALGINVPMRAGKGRQTALLLSV